jgi:WD40 repeat protein/AAA+ ATPase superfamily predicted ATPase
MSEFHDRNRESVHSLIRAITQSQDGFSLILARCNYASLREQIVQQLHQQCPVPIRELVLEQSVKTLYSTIEAELDRARPSTLMVFGLESVEALEQVLKAANHVREEFRNFAFPLVLWVTDEVLQTLIRQSSDFYGWATTVDFAIAPDALIHYIRQTTDSVFERVLDAGSSIFLDNARLELGVGSPHRIELESARQELQDRGINLEPELDASVEFVLGRDAGDSLERSRLHYERSLAYWQDSDNPERRGCLLFFLGLWWRTYLLGHRNEYESACRRAKYYFEQAIETFEQAERSDLVAKFINALGDSLQRLGLWQELETVARKAIALHEIHPNLFKLARAQGFLAEVFLAREEWSQARELALLALYLLEHGRSDTATPISSEELDWEFSFHQGWYLFSLAKAQSALGSVQAAIATLETAKANTKSEYDPELYIAILKQLRSHYFQEKDYLKAFQIKQERYAIEHRYGFRAFIGAGRLQPKQRVTNPALPHLREPKAIPQEIDASGRQRDIAKLRERLSRNDYKLTVIHGPSGVGKSSLLQVGLIPALQQKAIGTREVLPVLQRVYPNWVEKLGNCLGEALAQKRHRSTPTPLNSVAAILRQLRNNAEERLLTVLIFDQFEEFFFIYSDLKQRRQFYKFLQDCLNIQYVKILFSLREDYLYFLLEWNRLMNLEAINNNILDKNIRYYLGNFTRNDAKAVIQNLTNEASLYLEPALIDELVNDLAGELGEVRPIELQVVGAQLQAENITTLADYRRAGPKTELVKRFLEAAIDDCGPENKQAAQLVLYFLTDEKGTRPLKRRAELETTLSPLEEAEKLDLVLEILVKSGLVFQLPENPAERYQLVHDYLVTFIRQQQSLLAKLEKQREELLDRQAKIERLRRERWFLAGAISIGIILAIVSTWAEFQRRRAVTSEIKAHAVSAEALFAVNKSLDALRESLKAAIQLKRETWAKTDIDTRAEVLTALHQSVYGARELNRLEGHRGSVFSVSFSRDGQSLASASGDNSIKLWHPDGRLRATLEGHRNAVFDVSFSPDGQTIASASLDGTVKLWNLQGKELRTFEGHGDEVLSVSFSPDGQMLASASRDGTVKLWQTDGTLTATLEGHEDTVFGVSFSPDGQMLASASWDKTVKLWSRDGRLLQTLAGHTDSVMSVSFSRDGQTLVSTSLDGTVRLWNLEGEELKTLTGHEDGVFDARFSPDGQTLASASLDETIKLWNLEGELLQTLKGHQYAVYQVSFSPDGKTLASASGDRTVRLWSLDTAGLTLFRGHQGRVTNVSFSPDGQTLASASADRTVKLWRRDGTLQQTLEGHQAPVWSVSFSPDGQMIASASGDDASGSGSETVRDNTVRLWGTDGTLLNVLEGHEESVLSANFSPNGQIIASASRDRTIKLWHQNGQLIRTIIGHSAPVNWVSFSPDGQTIASASDDKTVKLWDLGGNLIDTLQEHQGEVLSVSFSPDGQMLASASTDGTIKLWNEEGEELTTLEEHIDWVYSVSFSPDGKTLASASRDGTVKWWDAAGNLLISLKRHEGAVYWASVSPDSQQIASASDDETLILWELSNFNLNDLLRRGCDRARNYLQYNPNLDESDRYLCNSINPQR